VAASELEGFNLNNIAIMPKVQPEQQIALRDKPSSFASQPIYKLLRAFNLQQYTRKLTDSGYGEEVYKLAVLNGLQRDELITQLKPMPGHKAKLSAFFTVIDEIYPRQKVIEQIKAVTPD